MRDLSDDIDKIKEMINEMVPQPKDLIFLRKDELEDLCMSCWQLGWHAHKGD